MTLLERRQVEAGIFLAMYTTLLREMEPLKALDTVARAVAELAEQAGRDFAAQAPDGPNFAHFCSVFELWRGSGSLDIADLNVEGNRVSFSVTRCAYVEAYRHMDLPDELAVLLSCARDEPFAKGYSPNIVMERPETIAEGAPSCPFSFIWRP
uniref:L-2-amino-thiazoline-4-carboxylic acid hydrolase n=1 Tax=Fundidesulfovibrio putealis TaxID=270496 RepID=A0A7C3WH71_9BACT